MHGKRTFRYKYGMFALEDEQRVMWIRLTKPARWCRWENPQTKRLMTSYDSNGTIHKLLVDSFKQQQERDQEIETARQAIKQMAEEMARNIYGIESDKEFWRLFLPEPAKRVLGWKMHEWHTPDDHDCRDNPSCVLCNLSVCRVCGLFEGGLTTECPGAYVDHETSEKVYRERLDFREGKWVEEFSPHQQSALLHQRWKINARRNR